MLREGREKLKETDSALVTAILVTAVLYFAREVFVPLALAGLLAFLLAPAAAKLERWGLKRAPAAVLVILLSFSGVGTLGWVVLEQIYNLAVELPQYQQNITEKVNSLHLNSAGRLSSTVGMLTSVSKQLNNGGLPATSILTVTPKRRSAPRSTPHESSENKDGKTSAPVPVRIEGPEESTLAMAGRTVMPLVHPLTTTFIVVIFLVFMLLGRDDLRDRGLRLAGSGRMHVTTTAIEDASRRVSRYLRMQLLVNLGYSTVVGLALWGIGVPNPLLWAVLTCLLRFVPYIGILMAAAGPLLLAIAVSPDWHQLIWTVIVFVGLEIVTANFVEPMLYGASTGISAIAILIAAIFWTLLWGLPGLLLSTPLSVCLVVIGRQVPRLHYLEVLFGEEAVLSPADRFYQRMLSSHTADATALLEEMLKSKSREEVYDSVVVPALSMIEDARHSEEITPARGDEILQAVEELAEDLATRDAIVSAPSSKPLKQVICIPARDFADEVACQLGLQVLAATASVRVISVDSPTADTLQTISDLKPDVISVFGIPPRAIRHVRMRCHQIRGRFPDAVIVACVLSKECDLSNLRSRIPTEDAQHAVCSLQLMTDYMKSLLHPAALPIDAAPEPREEAKQTREIEKTIHELEAAVVSLDGTEKDIFDRLAATLARSFGAPIAMITVADGRRQFWEAQCGLPRDTLTMAKCEWDRSVCANAAFSESTLIVADTAENEHFANDPFLREKGIRFYAGTPLKSHDGDVMGSICVLDTRPRQISDQQKDMLISTANSVMTAIELHGIAPSDETIPEPEPQSS